MDINKKRIHDYWILPKNNCSIERHRIYIAFVINFFYSNNKWPSVKEYKENIVEFLVSSDQNKKNKKTAENHQLFLPIFYGSLKIEGNVIMPTKIGMAFMLDTSNIYASQLIFEMYWNATFGTGATGTNSEYNDVHPIRNMFLHLKNKGELTFEDLSYGFTSKKDELGNEKITHNTSKKPAQWQYIITNLVDLKLIILEGVLSHIRPGTKEKPNKSYNKNGKIFPTLTLEKLIKENESHTSSIDKILSVFDIKIEEVDILKIIKDSRTALSQKRYSRDSAAQAAWKLMLLSAQNSCLICEVNHKSVLIASHIKPYAKCMNMEQFDVNNGLILCSNHDRLFDKGLFTFENKRIKFSKGLKIFNWDVSLDEEIVKKEFVFNEKQEEYLKYHREFVFKKTTK